MYSSAACCGLLMLCWGDSSMFILISLVNSVSLLYIAFHSINIPKLTTSFSCQWALSYQCSYSQRARTGVCSGNAVSYRLSCLPRRSCQCPFSPAGCKYSVVSPPRQQSVLLDFKNVANLIGVKCLSHYGFNFISCHLKLP